MVDIVFSKSYDMEKKLPLSISGQDWKLIQELHLLFIY